MYILYGHYFIWQTIVVTSCWLLFFMNPAPSADRSHACCRSGGKWQTTVVFSAQKLCTLLISASGPGAYLYSIYSNVRLRGVVAVRHCTDELVLSLGWRWYLMDFTLCSPVVILCTASLAFTILHSAHSVYLCVLCGSENKQRLFHCTALTGWFL